MCDDFAKQQEIAIYQKRIQALEEKLTATYQQAAAANKSKDIAELKTVQLNSDLAIMRETIEQLEAALRRETDYKEDKDKIIASKLQAELTELRSMNEKLEKRNEDYRIKLTQAAEENKLLGKTLEEAQQTILEKEAIHKESLSLLQSSQEKEAQLEEKMLETTQQLQSLQVENSILQAMQPSTSCNQS